MSRITIKENEQVGFNTFDATENVVLVPLLTPEDAGSSAALTPRLYSSLSEFISDYASAPGRTIEGEGSESSDSDFIEDKSYYFICELLNAGLKVLVKPFEESVKISSEDNIIASVNSRIKTGNLYKDFFNKNLYNIKFITTGYWPNKISKLAGVAGCCDTLAEIAGGTKGRQDCVALIEFEKEVTPTELLSLINVAPTANYKYAVCTYPAGLYSLPTAENVEEVMPGSFGYLMAFARSVRTNANWFAASGIIRGVIPNLISTNYDIGESMMQLLQDGVEEDGKVIECWKINPIMQTGTYGLRLWGNRVVASGSNFGVSKLTFSDFLNVRMLLCDLKKQVYHASLRSTFEPNDDITWINFKKLCNTLLDQMQSGRGISWYSWKKEKVTAKATIKAVLTIKPIEAVEYFDITINLSDEEVSIEEPVV